MTSNVSRHLPVALKPLAAALAVAAAFSSSALAHTTQDTTLAMVAVTASRTPQLVSDVLSDNIVITSEDIARSGQDALVDLLQRQRGIEITRNGGPGTNASVHTRGTNNNQTVVLIDGVRSGSSTAGGAPWSALPLSQIDRIEIVFGPLSSLYGADAMGGVVQIFTKKGEGALQVRASLGYGSEATRALETGVAGATGGEHGVRYALSVAHEESNGFSSTKRGASSFNPDRDGYRKDSASGQFSLALAKGHDIGMSVLQSRLNAQFDSGVSAYDAHSVSKLGSYALYANSRWLSNWTSLLQLSRSTDQLDSLTSNARPAGLSTFNTRQTNVSWQNDLRFGTDALQLVVEQRKEAVDSSRPELVRGRTTDSVAASYQLRRDAHLSNVSIRSDDNSQFGSKMTGSAAYGYRIARAWRANASIGTSFRAPTFNELYYQYSNTNFYGIASNRPERGKNAEAGLYYEDGKSQLSAVAFRNRITDLLVYANPCPIAPATHTFGCAYNVNQALLTGVSLGASTTQGNWALRGTLDLQDPRDETADKQLTRRAKRHGSLAVEYGAHAIKAGAQALFSGKRFDDTLNKNSLGGYGLLNLYASVDFAPNWSLFGRWNNVLDKKYELAKNYATAGSNLFAGVRYGFR